MSSRFPELSILVNNAGVVWGAPLEEFPAGGWEKVLHTNVEGIFHLTVALLPALRAAATAEDPARVINIGSIDGLRTPAMENYSYSASKAAVHMLTRHLAKRLAAESITVNAIAPGPFESKMMAFVLDDPRGAPGDRGRASRSGASAAARRRRRPDPDARLARGRLPDGHRDPARRRHHRLQLTRAPARELWRGSCARP